MARPLKAKGSRYLARPLNSVLSAPSHIAVLRTLKDRSVGATGREIAGAAGVARQATMNALSSLESAGIIQRSVAGRAYVFLLNRRHWLVREGLLPLLEAEEEFRRQVRLRLVKVAGKHAVAGALFGSAARGEEGPGSDLDVCFLVNDRQGKRTLIKHLDVLSDTLAEEFGLHLSPMVFTRSEFVRGHAKGERFFRNVVREGRTFHGPDMREVIGGKANAQKTRRSR